MSDDVGMPIFVHYGTNRAVLDIPDRIRGKHNFDKLSAIERAIDQQLDFRTFFEWYRNKEVDEIYHARELDELEYVDPALKYVRKAIETMIGDVSNLRIKRNPVRMVVDKSGKEIRVDMLSDGEKCTLALLGDLARRLILANPSAENPLEGEGIVLIDEIELHMHPTWQRRILHVLNEVFPNIQFIVTTHSPQVLGEVNNDYDIIPLMLDKDSNGIALTKIPRMDGYDSNMILEEYMETSSESEVKKKLVKILNEAIRKKDFDLAAQKLEELKNLAGETDEDYILSKGYMLRSRLK
jgi:predicted ATP-binding protein involved in virulence